MQTIHKPYIYYTQNPTLQPYTRPCTEALKPYTKRSANPALQLHHAWHDARLRFPAAFFYPKNFANFASEIDPASFEVRLEPSFREADTLWKSPGLISNPFETIC